MRADTLIAECRRLGIGLTANDGRLRVNAPAGEVSANLRASLAEHKATILAMLWAEAKGYVLETATDSGICKPIEACSELRHSGEERISKSIAHTREADLLENINERAGIIEDSNVPREESEAMAVRLVQCRGCRHFAAAASSPLAGIGTCSVGGWPQGGSERPSGPEGLLCRLAKERDSECSSDEAAG